MTTGNQKPKDTDNLNIEIRLLLEAIYLKYGYDFRDYSFAHIKRRILHRMNLAGLPNVLSMVEKVLAGHDLIQHLLSDLSINVTEMFRDPEFFKKVRSEVAPILQTYPHINIWHAGCATGEEVYSMAILLHEEDLLRRSQLYATDFNNMALRKAKEAVYPISAIKEYTVNYQKSGGKASFSDYYTARYNSAMIHNNLKNNVVFAMHNLAIEGPFAEVHMIVCRNVLIYFNRALQNKVIGTFTESLLPGGILCLGSKEDLQFSEYFRFFATVDPAHKIYRKKYDSTY